MVKPRPPSVERETSIQNSIRMWRRLGSPGYPAPETWLRQRIERDYDRCYYPLGISRHLLAVMAARDRTTLLKSIRVPTLIIHGRDDPLVPVDGGEDTAKWIPGAKLKVFDGMGHDLPMQLIPEIADLIAEHVRIAESSHEPSPATVN